MTQTGRISFGPLYHSTLGFDSIFRELERSLESPSVNSYPPHNIVKLDDNRYIVELAVAGYSKDEINITVEDRILTIKGDKNNQEEVTYLYKGISNKKFTKTIRIIETVEVKGAEFKDGILRIGLENIIPEEKKPRKIDIQDELIFYKPELLKE